MGNALRPQNNLIFNRRVSRHAPGEIFMLKKFAHALMALTMAFGFAMSSAPQAEAHGRGLGISIAAGIIGLGVLGAAAGAHGYPYRHRYYSAYDEGRECYRANRECHWTGRRCFENSWGDTVCRGGRYVCERALICE